MHQLGRLTTEGLKEWSNDPIDEQGIVVSNQYRVNSETFDPKAIAMSSMLTLANLVVATDV
jgi:hypothetical protein